MSQIDFQGNEHYYDAITIGGGPAGATFAATLAREGYSVLLLERKKFPRFHIGESMLPYMAGLLDRIGLLNEVETGGFVTKRGAEFTGETGEFRRVDFTAQGEGRKHSTFQVERAHFDQIMLDQASKAGARVLEEARVANLLFDDNRLAGVEYEHRNQRRAAKARFVADASGRSGKIANRLKLRKPNERLKMVAVYKHFGNLDERNNPGVYGDIQIGNHGDGWVWAIPIRDDIISVGVVTPVEVVRSSSPEEVFETQHARIPRILERLRGTTPLAEVKGETDYCYYSDKLSGPGYFILGDAGCFVDPVFSGGVFLGMVSGAKAAEAIDGILRCREPEERARTRYENFYKTGYDAYARLIYAFYESNFNFGRYLASLPIEVEGKWIARLLSGDFWSPHNPLTRHLRSESKGDTFGPFEPVYGCPVYPELDAQE